MPKKPLHPNEIQDANEAASEAAHLAASVKAVDPRRKANLIKAGVAVGIGSAAIVAALLYANRSRKNER